MKSNFKFLITSFILLLLFFNSFCFATDTNYETMLISDTTHYQESTTTDSDLYITNSEYEINHTINGNVFATVDNLNINSFGIIKGNLFVTADNVNIKSDVVYSDTEKDDLGNSVITINKSSLISGNAFILADKFVLSPECQIDGDLYICANEVHLEQNSKVGGDIFICANIFNLNGEIGGNLYANVETFDMKYYGFIFRDLYLNAQEVNLNGMVYRNSFISAQNIISESNFVNQENFTVTDADNLTFSGQISGDATINAKNITFKYLEDMTKPIGENNNKLITCKIYGNLNSSSQNDIRIVENAVIMIEDHIVLGEVNHGDYVDKSTKNILSNIFDYVLNLIGLLLLAYVLYVLISKFGPKYLEKISNISGLNLLKYLGIGLGFLILVPIISILLLITSVGSIIGLILLLIYIILLIIAKPIFIISIAKFAKNKMSNKFSIYLYILAITVTLSLITIIPYVGLIISLLINFIGFGIIAMNLMPSKK